MSDLQLLLAHLVKLALVVLLAGMLVRGRLQLWERIAGDTR